MRLFYYFNFERNYDVLKLTSPCFLLNLYKNETGSKIENPIHTVKEINIVLQIIQESQVKNKTVMSWSSRKKKECIFFILP